MVPEVEPPPGAKMPIPCRARGMSMEHNRSGKQHLTASLINKQSRDPVFCLCCRANNPLFAAFYRAFFQTAYFVISQNIKHGDNLVCTYPTCRNPGITFRYCAECKEPVAQRNSAKKHSHREGMAEALRGGQ
jgi:hypothetical protein